MREREKIIKTENKLLTILKWAGAFLVLVYVDKTRYDGI